MEIGNDWGLVLKEEFEKNYYRQLRIQLDEAYKTCQVFPAREQIFNALKWTAYQDVKVVILGQDPYHGEGQAHGLSFSVNVGVKVPPSLQNIYKELKNDLNCDIPNHGYLESWARQGVLLLNAALTVRSGEAASHSKIGWQQFTDQIIVALNNRKEPIVFVLWGNYARTKRAMITNERHFVIESAHPSPLSAHRGFFGSKPFSQTNTYLLEGNQPPIEWQIKSV